MNEINWGYNCLTGGIHHGRPEKLWNLPLLQAVKMFSAKELKDLVVTRIYQDAMQMVQHEERQEFMTTEWADRIKALVEENYDTMLRIKVGEIHNFYTSPVHQKDAARVVEWFKQGKLNSNYEPLHGHDSINMLCRILGSSSEGKVSYDMTHQ